VPVKAIWPVGTIDALHPRAVTIPASDVPPNAEPALVAARVIDNAVQLARAEAGLVLAHVRIVWVGSVRVLLAMLLATSSAQVALLLIALSPILFPTASLSMMLVALLPSLALTCGGAWLTVSAWRSLKRGSSRSGAEAVT
jgi:hypothetical protein